MDKARKNAHFVVDNPLSSQNQIGMCCIYQFIGIVVDDYKLESGYRIMRRLKEEIRESKGQPVKILHSPSLPAIKGTKRIRSCIDSLKEKGFDIAYVELTGRSNREVAEALARCDFVIDQLYSDIHGAIFATEAAAFGKPAVVCGYGKEVLEKFVPQEAIFPSIFVHPDNLESVVKKLIVDADYRLECGAASLHYFTNFGDRREIARRLLVLASGEAPRSWFFDPNDVHYVEGVGGTNEAIAANIRKLVNHSGDKALLMDDKPILKQRILELAQRFETPRTGTLDGQ